MLPEIPGLIKDEAWHRRRAAGIGSSDWNHLLAGNDSLEYKYWCVRKLYYEKNMVKPDFPEFPSALAARGTFLEGKVLQMFKIDTKCRYVGGRQKRAKYACPGILLPEYWQSQPDARAKFPERPGEIETVEAKSMGTGMFNHYKEEGISVGYKLQCQAHNAQQGSEMTWLVVGYFGDYLDYQVEPMPRDNEVISKMITIADHFWYTTRMAATPPPRPEITPERCGSCRYRLRCIGKTFVPKGSRPVDLSKDEELYKILSEVEDLKLEVLVANKKKKVLQELARKLVQESGDPGAAFCKEILIANKLKFSSSFDRKRLEAEDIHTARRYVVSEARQSFTSKVTKRSQDNWEAHEDSE